MRNDCLEISILWTMIKLLVKCSTQNVWALLNGFIRVRESVTGMKGYLKRS